MFVAVRGGYSDGHDYLLDALQRGAAGLLVEARAISSIAEESQAALEHARVATVVVEDTRIPLQEYAPAILGRWRPTGIPVTGSPGKTRTKTALAAVLAHSF